MSQFDILLISLNQLSQNLENGFKRIEDRFKRVEERLDQHENGLQRIEDQHENGLKRIEERLDQHENGLQRIEERLDQHESGLQRIEERLDQHENGIKRIEERLDQHENGIKSIEKKMDQHEDMFNTMVYVKDIPMSDTSSNTWKSINEIFQIKVNNLDKSALCHRLKSLRKNFKPFKWLRTTEPSQLDAAIAYIGGYLDLGSFVAEKATSLGLRIRSGNFRASGRTDIILYDKDLLEEQNTAEDIIKVCFELKKPNKEKNVSSFRYQAMIEQVAASDISTQMVFTVLTNLQDYWQIFWFSGEKELSCICTTGTIALSAIQLIIDDCKKVEREFKKPKSVKSPDNDSDDDSTDSYYQRLEEYRKIFQSVKPPRFETTTQPKQQQQQQQQQQEEEDTVDSCIYLSNHISTPTKRYIYFNNIISLFRDSIPSDELINLQNHYGSPDDKPVPLLDKENDFMLEV